MLTEWLWLPGINTGTLFSVLSRVAVRKEGVKVAVVGIVSGAG